MTKPGNSGSDEPKTTPDPEQAAEAAGAKPNAASDAETYKIATGSAPTGDEVNPEGETNPSESPTGAPGGPPVSNATGDDRQSGADDESPVDNSAAVDNSGDEADEAAEAPAKSAKPKRAKQKQTIDEPLMAELEKAPPAPEEPVMPTAREEALRRQASRRFEEPPPRTLRISFYFFLASGLIWLISMIASVVLKQDIIDAQIKANKDPKLTAEQISNGVTQILWVVLVASLTFTVFLGLFGYKATEGTRRARTLVTIIASVLVLFHLLLNGTPAGILSAMFGLVGLALLWSPSARSYFAPREPR